MGTTVVKKGANRPAHNARTAKAAQRTPLPPRGSQPEPRRSVEIAKEMVAEKKAKTSKQERLARSRAPKEFKPAGGGKRDLRADAKEYGAKVVELRGKGMTWLHIAQACGREGNLTTISVWADRVYKLHTKGAADNKPSNKGTRTPKEIRPVSAALPWVAGQATDDEITGKLAGRKIVWRNSLSGAIEESKVNKSRPIHKYVNGEQVVTGQTSGPRIERNREDRRVVNFVSPAGFRSVYVDAILEVR